MSFDPTKKATKEKKAAKRSAPKPKTDAPDLDAVLEQHARSIIDAYAVLDSIESRCNGEISPVTCCPSAAELLAIRASGIECDNVHELVRLVDHCRANQRLRGTLNERTDAIENARETLSAILEREAELKAAAEGLDALHTPQFVQQIEKMQAEINTISQDRQEAEQRLAKLENARTVLLMHVPKPLKESIDAQVSKVRQSDLFKRKSDLEGHLREMQTWLDPNTRCGPHGVDWKSGEAHALFAGYAKVNCPQSLSREHGNPRIDEQTFMEHVGEIEAALPAKQLELDQLAPQCDEVEERIRGPLYQWVDTGQMTVESLTATGGEAGVISFGG